MEAKSQWSKQRRGVISMFNVHIEALGLAKEIERNAPIKAVFGSVIDILATIRVSDLLAFVHVSLKLKYT